MARGIVIPFTLDPRAFTRGLRTITTDLDDVRRGFARVEDSGDDAADGIERSFEGLGRSFEQEVDRMERAARGADLDDQLDLDRGGTLRGRAGIVGAEVADEFSENFGEAIRSGNPTDALLETFTSLGPALGALGLGAALVTGLVNNARQEAARQAGVLRGAVASLLEGAVSQAEQDGKSIAAALINPTLGLADKLATVQEFYGADDLLSALDRANADAELLGVNMLDIVDAIGGQGAQQQAANSKLREAQNRWEGIADAADKPPSAIGRAAGKAGELTTQAARAQARLDQLTAAADATAGNLKRGADYARELDDQLRDAAEHAADVQWQINQIPRSVTVNVVNKVKRLPL